MHTNIFYAVGEYQCVWNADGIIDNTATPAGISHVLWAAGQTADELYRKRETKACRVWEMSKCFRTLFRAVLKRTL